MDAPKRARSASKGRTNPCLRFGLTNGRAKKQVGAVPPKATDLRRECQTLAFAQFTGSTTAARFAALPDLAHPSAPAPSGVRSLPSPSRA